MSWFKGAGKNIAELRIHLCQQSPASSGLREYLAKNYQALKKASPDVPIMVREATGAPARAFARFDYGVEKKVVLNDLSAAEVEVRLKELITRPQ